ncbi:hypothetical protein E3N88_27788 [Mikania micrantha]|uniref:Reverse transcriptase domain-containing protein n=1 Tax=Mikania micrantha TaxID=192012 RepID=A0A5N6MYS8_9ASTR|nr:hypothetical protein E3N88_27788 [Mikania micrantha]
MAKQDGRPPWTCQVENLPSQISSGLKPSIVSPPKVELKELPKHLKYAFLGEDQTLPVIIASHLEKEQEEALLRVLKDHKAAIGWSIADLTGISPSIVMHKIITDADAKPARDTQRRLNPNMREVVKKEVIKWLDAGIIYPISDSLWVSPTQTVPKKAGIQIVQSESGEQIATRPVTGWRVCIDYRKLNAATSKDHFPLPFIDQIVEKLSAHFDCFKQTRYEFQQLFVNILQVEMVRTKAPIGKNGKSKSIASSSAPKAKKQRRIQLRDESEDEQQLIVHSAQFRREQMEREAQERNRPPTHIKWDGGLLSQFEKELQVKFYNEKINNLTDQREAFICEREITDSEFRPFGIVQKF